MNVDNLIIYSGDKQVGTIYSTSSEAWATDMNLNAVAVFDRKTQKITVDITRGEINFDLLNKFLTTYSVDIKPSLISIYIDLVNKKEHNFLPNGTRVKFKKGYLVSVFNKDRSIDLKDFNGTIKILSEVVKLAELTDLFGTFIGVWHTDKFSLLDLTINVEDLRVAYDLAEAFDQHAIYNVEKGATIYIDL